MAERMLTSAEIFDEVTTLLLCIPERGQRMDEDQKDLLRDWILDKVGAHPAVADLLQTARRPEATREEKRAAIQQAIRVLKEGDNTEMDLKVANSLESVIDADRFDVPTIVAQLIPNLSVRQKLKVRALIKRFRPHLLEPGASLANLGQTTDSTPVKDGGIPHDA